MLTTVWSKTNHHLRPLVEERYLRGLRIAADNDDSKILRAWKAFTETGVPDPYDEWATLDGEAKRYTLLHVPKLLPSEVLNSNFEVKHG